MVVMGGYIVYDPRNFDERHTHVDHYRVAKTIKKNVDNFIIPRSRNKRTIVSHLRVASNKIYIERLQEILDDIENEKKAKKKDGDKING